MNLYFRKIIKKIAYKGWLDKISDERYLRLLFLAHMNKKLDLHNPLTMNEKLQWLKLYDRKDLYTTLVDKYAMKQYLKNYIPEECIIPTLGVWERYEDIDFSTFPEQFVLKCTHDSGGVVICKNKNEFDSAKAKAKLERSLHHNYYLSSREWPYKNVAPRIIAEPCIGEGSTLPEDYKFYTFGGEIDSVMVCKGREFGYPKFYFFDMEWNRLNYQKEEPMSEHPITKPTNFDEMVSIVRKLAKKFIQARIDLYNVNGKIYFGEITLFNQSGFDMDIFYNTDLMWGRKIKLPLEEKI